VWEAQERDHADQVGSCQVDQADEDW